MMNQVQNLSQYGMWNCTAMKHQAAAASSDGSWEVRAFAAEDTVRVAMETSMEPPQYYTCSFCWREFRSAQALGGHMNVHRRDRARRLYQSQQGPAVEPSPASTFFSSPKFVAAGAARGGLCFFYPMLPSRDGPVFPRALMKSPSTLLSMSPYQAAANFPTGSDDSFSSDTDGGGLDEEIDLELRLEWP